MDNTLNRRALLGSAASLLAVPALAATVSAQEKPAAAKGQLTTETLALLLKAMGAEAKRTESRYDFAFKSIVEGEEWVLSMSVVLSEDGTAIWAMAWLDELPKAAADVPRTALLRLLADNDKLGNGKFFAYIPTNRRFVLQRVIPNANISTKMFREMLDDLGQSVAMTYPHWSTTNWSSNGATDPAAESKATSTTNGSAPQRAPSQQVINSGKFDGTTRR